MLNNAFIFTLKNKNYNNYVPFNYDSLMSNFDDDGHKINNKDSSEDSDDLINSLDKKKIKNKQDDTIDTKDKMVKIMIKLQLSKVPLDKKLTFKDMKRICKNINSDIFNNDICSIWTGHITNSNNGAKGKYINFYFRGKKRALHRLLYTNFVGMLLKDEYLKFSCENKGICCNINHLNKFKYNISENEAIKETTTDKILSEESSLSSPNPDDKINKSNDNAVIIEKKTKKKKIIINFD
jgi:hypothetical protein